MDLKMVSAFKALVEKTNARHIYKDAPLEFSAAMFDDGHWGINISSTTIFTSIFLGDIFELCQLFRVSGFISCHKDILSYHIQ